MVEIKGAFPSRKQKKGDVSLKNKNEKLFES
jgi:hypothetical protein